MKFLCTAVAAVDVLSSDFTIIHLLCISVSWGHTVNVAQSHMEKCCHKMSLAQSKGPLGTCDAGEL